MKFKTFWKRFMRVTAPDGRLVTPVPHREQARVIAAMDARDARGLRPSRDVFLHWAKKTSKSMMGAAIGVYHLVKDPFEHDDRLIGIASYDEEQSFIIFDQCRQIVERHPELKDRVRILRGGEMVYTEACVEPRTGGTFTREHRLRALARDTKGTHGEPWSLIIRDEVWSEPNHDFSEALIPSPTRVCPLTIHLSYSGLKSMMRPGVPLHDLLLRARQGDPRLLYSYIGGLGADASWNVCPWITEEWIDAQRRLFVACPSKFDRIILNKEVTADGDTLVSTDEIAAARVTILNGPDHVPAGRRYEVYVGLDLGISNDHAALAVTRFNADAKAVVEHTRVWKGTPTAPVDFGEIEDHLLGLRRVYAIQRLTCDAWNAHYLISRLVKAGIPATAITVEQSRIDEIITALKVAFSRRHILVPDTEIELLAQIESLRTLETRTPRRDLLKLAPSGTGLDATQHDDMAIALGLALCDRQHGKLRIDARVGKVMMAELSHGCAVEGYFKSGDVDCYLWGGMRLPAGAVCAQCPGNTSTLAARDAHRARTGHYLDLREFVRRGLIAPNAFVSARVFDRHVVPYL